MRTRTPTVVTSGKAGGIRVPRRWPKFVSDVCE
jgi:hypothetical protein